MHQGPSSSVRNLLLLSAGAALFIVANCSAPSKPTVPVTVAPEPAAESEPLSHPAQVTKEYTGPNFVDRKARVVTRLTPDEVLQLAGTCAAAKRPDYAEYEVAGVSLDLNLGLPMAVARAKVIWMVHYRSKVARPNRPPADREFWIDVDDTARTAHYRSGQ